MRAGTPDRHVPSPPERPLLAQWRATARPQHPLPAWQKSAHSGALDTFEELLSGLDAHDAQRWKTQRIDFASRTTLGSLLNDRAKYVVGRALDAAQVTYRLDNPTVRNPDLLIVSESDPP
ncbi:hypothetical protein [Streptomyces sp. NPDC056544]|uniref:hypothetical protein n=1 Tax=unclassified Streptomyces TaxID=2593676 RepID=UPI0036816BCC